MFLYIQICLIGFTKQFPNKKLMGKLRSGRVEGNCDEESFSYKKHDCRIQSTQHVPNVSNEEKEEDDRQICAVEFSGFCTSNEEKEKDDRQICAAEFSGFYTNLHNSVDNRVLQL